MYLAELVEVAIGLIVVFFLMSLASSEILNWLSRLVGWRAHDLEFAIRGMVLNQSVESSMFSGVFDKLGRFFRWITGKTVSDSAEDIIKQLYKHPLIKPLSERFPVLGIELKPTNIPARTFALALLDTVMTAGTDASAIQQALYTVRGQLDDPQGLQKNVNDALGQLIAQAQAAAQANDAQALNTLKTELDKFTQKYSQFKPVIDAVLQVNLAIGKTTVDQVQKALVGIAVKNPELKRTLENLVSAVAIEAKKGEDAIAAARTNVETWFNSAMDQLTALYQRRSKVWAGLIALALAIMLNVDAVTIATTLWREPTLRQSLVAYAEKIQPPPTTEPSATQTMTVTVPLTPTMSSSQTVTVTVPLTSTTSLTQTADNLRTLLEDQLQLPIGGWGLRELKPAACDQLPLEAQAVCKENVQQCTPTLGPTEFWPTRWNNACYVFSLRDLPQDLPGYLFKFAGWILTALAAAQGAPFWYDLLQKLLALRGTEKKPEEKPVTT